MPAISIKRKIVAVAVEKVFPDFSARSYGEWLKSNAMVEEANNFRARHQGFDCGDIVQDCLSAKNENFKQVIL